MYINHTSENCDSGSVLCELIFTDTLMGKKFVNYFEFVTTHPLAQH